MLGVVDRDEADEELDEGEDDVELVVSDSFCRFFGLESDLSSRSMILNELGFLFVCGLGVVVFSTTGLLDNGDSCCDDLALEIEDVGDKFIDWSGVFDSSFVLIAGELKLMLSFSESDIFLLIVSFRNFNIYKF